jgi:hypothetical protein
VSEANTRVNTGNSVLAKTVADIKESPEMGETFNSA